jgi:hypothetical protein
MQSIVFLVEHVHEFDDRSEDAKIVGIYSTQHEAAMALARSRRIERPLDNRRSVLVHSQVLACAANKAYESADITKDRVKPVTPAQGFGPKRAPAEQELGWLEKMARAIRDLVK